MRYRKSVTNTVKRELGYWKNLDNQKECLKSIEILLNIKTWTDWYKYGKVDVVKHGGLNLIKQYGGSRSRMLYALYPQHPWNPMHYEIRPNFWVKKENQRRFLDDLFEKLNFKKMDDWYSITRDDILSNNGGRLLSIYKGSPTQVITSVYSEHEWQPWRFQKSRHYLWEDEEVSRKFLEWGSHQLGLNTDKNMENWYSVSNSQLRSIGGSIILEKYKNVLSILRRFFPEISWKTTVPKVYSLPSMSQHQLLRIVKSIFPNEKRIHMDYHIPKLYYDNTNRKMEFDIFIPSLSLAFEYQGSQHYVNHHHLFGDSTGLRSRDLEKKEKCKRHHIKLVEVPYTWDYSRDSLIKIIKRQFPNLEIQSKELNQESTSISSLPFEVDNDTPVIKLASPQNLGILPQQK